MSIIRRNIMESAIRHFSEHGFSATSIQDIADDCGISKGSFYKFFQSKEDLFIAFNESLQDTLFTKMESIRLDPSLSLKEAFILETECHFEFFLNNKFIMHDIKKLDASKGEFAPYFLRLRESLLEHSRIGLLRLLGEEAKSNIWDLVVMYNGIMREFMFLLIYEKKLLDVRAIAAYVVDRIEELAACIVFKKTEPILQNAIMNYGMCCETAGRSIFKENYKTSLLQDLISTVKELSITQFRKTELNDAIALLQEELANENPKSVLIHALLDFVGKEHELNNTVRQLERFVL
ncbi:AcrR family transcriptional regulator [Paenibacillus castaneae]|uniref:TetR/AcrR family transcriptional regulator n=1 Tax=Paenibacillus castaneae TaxID=474957 RepID=UPI00141BBDFD|nr:TetR/AcrR family transcriptional regulator [Paenibacillus castaneae]NIK79553.1 AcrR family transcriptional regulator [Paenibacillus castaneae]